MKLQFNQASVQIHSQWKRMFIKSAFAVAVAVAFQLNMCMVPHTLCFTQSTLDTEILHTVSHLGET